MREALQTFGRQIEGYSMDDAVMTGVETRTSSPVRMTRGADFQSLNVKGLYPAGEGAGYAGGILSAAIDGIKVAEAVALGLRGPRRRLRLSYSSSLDRLRSMITAATTAPTAAPIASVRSGCSRTSLTTNFAAFLPPVRRCSRRRRRSRPRRQAHAGPFPRIPTCLPPPCRPAFAAAVPVFCPVRRRHCHTHVLHISDT